MLILLSEWILRHLVQKPAGQLLIPLQVLLLRVWKAWNQDLTAWLRQTQRVNYLVQRTLRPRQVIRLVRLRHLKGRKHLPRLDRKLMVAWLPSVTPLVGQLMTQVLLRRLMQLMPLSALQWTEPPTKVARLVPMQVPHKQMTMGRVLQLKKL